MALARIDPRDVRGPTATALGTVLVPFEDPRGVAFTVELSRPQWHALALAIHEQFARIDHEVAVGRAVLDIERHESVT